MSGVGVLVEEVDERGQLWAGTTFGISSDMSVDLDYGGVQDKVHPAVTSTPTAKLYGNRYFANFVEYVRVTCDATIRRRATGMPIGLMQKIREIGGKLLQLMGVRRAEISPDVRAAACVRCEEDLLVVRLVSFVVLVFGFSFVVEGEYRELVVVGREVAAKIFDVGGHEGQCLVVLMNMPDRWFGGLMVSDVASQGGFEEVDVVVAFAAWVVTLAKPPDVLDEHLSTSQKSWEKGGSSALLSSVWSMMIMAVSLEDPELGVDVLCTLGGGSMLVELVINAGGFTPPSGLLPEKSSDLSQPSIHQSLTHNLI
eukprot:scaffold8341_cov57-Attheya_sp.AAC.5